MTNKKTAIRRGTESSPADGPVRDGGNVFGADPHKRTLTATMLDERGGVLGTSVFNVSGEGHRAMEAWALSFGPVSRWGIEGAAGIGRHTAMFLARRGHDVRDVCPNRTNERARGRRQGKSDALDSLRVARETQACPDVPVAFKRAGNDSGPDERSELMALWHKVRRSVLKSRQHLLNEAEAMLGDLPEDLRASLPDTSDVQTRLTGLAGRDRSQHYDAVTELRLRLLRDTTTALSELEGKEKEATAALAALIEAAGSTLDRLCGLSTRSVAELLVEVGDARRMTEGGFARFNGTAPLPASSAEGDSEPIRHRLNRGGNRRVNSVLHLMAITQLRCEPRARQLYEDARRRGHTKKEAMRILKRQLSNLVYRRMIADIVARQAAADTRSAAA
ncbi:MAG: transposase [Actinomycetota bacterium]|nr:transposase [Actinomycetota bacterium]